MGGAFMSVTWRHILLLAIACWTLAICIAAPTSSKNVCKSWVEYTSVQVMEDAKFPKKETTNEIIIKGMKGEVESRQVVMRCSKLSIPTGVNINMTFSDLTGGKGNHSRVISSSAISWKQQGYVLCPHKGYHQKHGPGWYPDPLFPADDDVWVRERVTATNWVFISIPLDAPAGHYEGTWTVSTIASNTSSLPAIGDADLGLPSQILAHGKIKLQVWPLTIPPVRDSKFGAIFTYYNVPFVKDQRDQYLDFQCEHRTPADNSYTPGDRDMVAYDSLVEKCGATWMNIAQLDFACGATRKLAYTEADINATIKCVTPAVEALQAKGYLGERNLLVR